MFAKWIESDGRFAISIDDNGGKEISDDVLAALFEGQMAGKKIVPDADGYPVLQDPTPPSANQSILNQIVDLEATVTPRRLREAVLSADSGWLAGVNEQIAALRRRLS